MTKSLALETRQLGITFGGLKAVCDLNLQIPEGSIYGLIGPNGAGKTTAFNLLTGVYSPTNGSIFAFGKEITAQKPYDIVAQGVSRTFQNIRLFKDLSVLDNVLIALDHHPEKGNCGLWRSLVQGISYTKHESEKKDFVISLLKIFKLDDKMNIQSASLPYGDQRRLEIARALATGARLILLDEPAAGMNAKETSALMATIRQIRKEFNVTVLLIEHDMKLVMGICERIAVLDYGVKIADGTPGEIKTHPKVIEAYLGTAA